MSPDFVKIASKTIGTLGMGAVLLDANAMGVSEADSSSKQGIAKHAIRQHIGLSKMDYQSPLYNAIREDRKDRFPDTFVSVVYGIKGYFKGLYDGIVNNLPLVGFSALALFAKNNITRKAAMIGAGLSALWSFIKNGTTLFEKKDYLD